MSKYHKAESRGTSFRGSRVEITSKSQSKSANEPTEAARGWNPKATNRFKRVEAALILPKVAKSLSSI